VKDPVVRCAKKTIFKFFLFALEMVVLSVFLAKKGLGSLGVNLKSSLIFLILLD